jgi:cysteinyl-tRNA synthetase
LAHSVAGNSHNEPALPKGDAFEKVLSDAWAKVETSLNDDFNTPEAFAAMFEVVRVLNSQVKRGMGTNPTVQSRSQAFLEFMRKLGKPMALFQEDPTRFLTTLDDMLLSKMNLNRSEIDILVSERSKARTGKDFKKSDELRDKLSAMGISVMDYPGGSFWEVTK